METSQLSCKANQVAGFFIRYKLFTEKVFSKNFSSGNWMQIQKLFNMFSFSRCTDLFINLFLGESCMHVGAVLSGV